jgi:DNA-binding transcriptional regulator YiaG
MKSEDRKKIGKRIRFVRDYILEESQRVFASRIGTTQKSLSLWESGKITPPTEILVKISQQTETTGNRKSVDWLLGLEPDKTLNGQ